MSCLMATSDGCRALLKTGFPCASQQFELCYLDDLSYLAIISTINEHILHIESESYGPKI
jgi:hypothetical protein